MLPWNRRSLPMSLSVHPLSTQAEAAFQHRLQQARLPAALHPEYHKWLRLYLHFCRKFRYPPTAPTSLGPFLTKLAAKNQSIEQRHHAAAAVKVFLKPPVIHPGSQLSPFTPLQPRAAQPAPGRPTTTATPAALPITLRLRKEIEN